MYISVKPHFEDYSRSYQQKLQSFTTFADTGRDMEFSYCEIQGLTIITPTVFGDSRGYFYESYHKGKFYENGLDLDFVQDNQSLSGKGILRGLHFQNPPYEQGKLIRVIEGAIIDVVVDIRKSSPSYGKSFQIELNAENKVMFWVPPGFAHGFCTLEDRTIVTYKCTGLYSPENEDGLMWNDPGLAIDWPLEQEPLLSAKDTEYTPFSEFVSPFE